MAFISRIQVRNAIKYSKLTYLLRGEMAKRFTLESRIRLETMFNSKETKKYHS